MMQDQKKGFSLLETIIALAILSMAIIGPFQLAIRSIASSVVSQNQITAFYLAQEGLEYIRNKRDSNLIQGREWLSGLGECKSVNGCYIDVPNDTIGECSSECPVLKFDENGYYYNYQYGNDTIFVRKILITNPVGDNSEEANIRVIVSWKDKFSQKEVIVEENIFDW